MLFSRHTRRRTFIAGLGSAAACPVVARAQQGDRVRRIGVFMALAADDPETASRTAALLQTLQQFGWADGRNVRIEYRSSLGDAERVRRYAAELAALGPDIILAVGGAHTAATLQATRTIPIVFVQATDPVGAGLVANLARPGGNVTGFTSYEYGISAKCWISSRRSYPA
jgi:putative ABC transport system substrate-binding protein